PVRIAHRYLSCPYQQSPARFMKITAGWPPTRLIPPPSLARKVRTDIGMGLFGTTPRAARSADRLTAPGVPESTLPAAPTRPWPPHPQPAPADPSVSLDTPRKPEPWRPKFRALIPPPSPRPATGKPVPARPAGLPSAVRQERCEFPAPAAACSPSTRPVRTLR